ncbi:MAG: heme-binding protein [Roseiarcus sp.]
MRSKHLMGMLAGAAAALALTGAAFAVDASKLALPGDLTLAQAQKVVAAAEAKAQQQGTLMNIAVIDAGGNLKAFARMDGAFLGSIDISLKKAKTAREFNMSSKELGDLAQPGKPLYGIEVTNGGLAIFGGGELIRDKSGTIIGAIGVSGSSVEDDMAVSQAGAAGL